MAERSRSLVALLVSASVLAACGGGAHSPVTPPGGAGSTGSGQHASYEIVLKMPGAKPDAQRRHRRSAAMRHALTVSRDTQGIGVEFQANGSTPYSGPPSTTPAFGAAIAPGSGGCAAASSNGAYNCTIYVPGVPVGYDDFRIALWNEKPSGCSPQGAGCTMAGAVIMRDVITNQAIKAGQNNTYAYTLFPVVDSVAVSLSGGIVDGTPSTLTAYVTARDADGDIILGSGAYMSPYGYPVSLYPVVRNNLPGGCGVSPPCSLTTTLSAPFTSGGTNSFTIAYDGKQQFPSTGAGAPEVYMKYGDFNPSSSSSSSSSSSEPTNQQHPVALIPVTQTGGSLGVGGVPQVAGIQATFGNVLGAALTSSGLLWLPDGTELQCLALAGSCSAGYAFLTPNSGTAGAMTYGADGDIWYVDTTNHTVNKFAPSVGPSGVVTSPAITGTPTLNGIAFGSDGNVYVTDSGNNKIEYVNPNDMGGTPTVISGLVASSGVSAIAAGPPLGPSDDGSVCFVEPDSVQGHIACLDTTQLPVGIVSTSNTKATPYSVITGPDNLIYVGEKGYVESFDVSTGALSKVAQYNLASTSAEVTAMAVGADNNIWFAERGSPLPTIGRIDLQSSPSGTLQEWNANTGSTFEGMSGVAPVGMVEYGGNLYFADGSSNQQIWEITP